MFTVAVLQSQGNANPNSGGRQPEAAGNGK